ncbi:MAG: hypothetical protein C4581_04400 [Nitrospiraceae bacterium]|nr:MAG: hypothetical protein C4581_04400 [Nitrospiraceae bacterium]
MYLNLPEKEADMAYYRDISGDIDVESDEYIEIFGEFNFTSFDNECNFFCPECRDMLKCAAYIEFSQEWESFYT